MSLGSGRSSGRMAPLNAWVMAIALVLAAFTGGGLGLVWQLSGFAEDAEDPDENGEAQDEVADEEGNA